MKIVKMIKAFFRAKYEKAVELLDNNGQAPETKRLLWSIPDYYLYRHVGRNNAPLYIYLLGLKHGKTPQVDTSENVGYIKVGGRKAAKLSEIPVFIHFLYIENGRLVIEGNTSCPKCFEENYKIGAETNGNIYDIVCEKAEPYWFGENFYESKEYFRCEKELRSDTEIAFVNIFDGKIFPCVKINVFRFSPVSDIIKYQYCVLGDWMIYISGGKIIVKRADENAIAEREKLFRGELFNYAPQTAEWVADLRKKYFEDKKNVRKSIWLCMDRAMSADDNAKIFFRYIQRYEDIESYFIISDKSPDYEEMKKYGRVVDIYSEEHYRLTFLAEYMISSQANGAIENPFWEKAEMFRDLYHHPKLIFLQHGVIKDDMSLTLNRFNTNFTGFITSTEDEKKSILTYPYGYSEKEVWLTGLPRFDELYDDKQKYILIMPSWRKSVMRHVWNEEKHDMVWEVTDNFEETGYFKRYRSLLNNKKLESLCAEYGYKIAFMPHPLMQGYAERFLSGSIAELWDGSVDYQTAFAHGDLMITDYSSVAFDFAYLRKPIVYYQFDAEEFYAGHTYRKGYFDYDTDGFGEVAYSEDELVDVICGYITSGMELKEEYALRMDRTFNRRDKNNCERIYQILTAKGKENKI